MEEGNPTMKTAHSSQHEASAADSSAPAADRPATASNTEPPQPTVSEDMEANTMLSEDPLGNLPMPPEIMVPGLAELETWDAPANESGYRVAPQTAEDEAEFPEILVEEGLDEAEEELRSVQDAEEKLIEQKEEDIEEAREAKK